MTEIAESETETTHLAPAIAAVARRADFVALLVAHALDAVYAKAGIDAKTDQSCRLPAGFLLELGAVMQLLLWERAGLTVHVEAGLPTADAAGEELERRARLGPSEFDDVSRLTLWRKVNMLWTEHFAWDGQQLLGAEIAVERGDEDALVDHLANFIWRNRRALTDHLEIEEPTT
jgi:hypothetical protein